MAKVDTMLDQCLPNIMSVLPTLLQRQVVVLYGLDHTNNTWHNGGKCVYVFQMVHAL